VLAVPPDRGGELAGLGVSEQFWAVDPEPVQVGLHSPRGRPGLRGHIDPHQHDVGVGLGGRDDVASASLEVAMVAKPAEGAGDRGAGPVVGGVASGEQERAGVGDRAGREAGGDPVAHPRQELRGLLDPRALGERPEPGGERG